MTTLLRHALLLGGLAVAILPVAAQVATTSPPAESPPQAQPSPGDQTLQSTLRKELDESPVVDAEDVQVSVDRGIVTLAGEVLDLMTKETSVEIAMSLRGVESVIDLMKVVSIPRSDAELTTLVRQRLEDNPATSDEALTIDAQGGAVTLQGQVDSSVEAELILRTVKQIRGVQSVNDRVRVRRSEQRRDEDIRHDIEQRMRWDPRLDDDLVKVAVQDGQVVLRGRVGSDEERWHARLSTSVEGVAGVEDQLEIDPSLSDQVHRDPKRAFISDSDLRQTVLKAWDADPRVDSEQIEAEVAAGVVTLTGTVDRLSQKLAAEQTAGHTLGVIQVRNELKVRPAQARPDAAIRGDVQRELAADPIVDRETIKVAVIDGEVFLSGTAGSHYERSRAEELALRVAGVKQLRNRIEVAKNAPEFDSALGVYGSESQGERPADATAKIHVKSDRVIQRDIESELWWSPWVEANEIDVSVKGGVATLEGTIDSEHERTAAIENAFEGGAVVVRDELKVRK